MTEQAKILEIEVIVTKKFIWKDEWKNFLSFGLLEIFDMVKSFGINMIEVTLDRTVYHVRYRDGKEVFRRQLPLTFEEFRQVLRGKQYVDDTYKYVFLKKRLKIFDDQLLLELE